MCVGTSQENFYALKNVQSLRFFKNNDAYHHAAELITLKSRVQLIYPNTHLYKLLSKV